MDALGQVCMGEFRSDCAAYIVKHNKKFQLRLNEQQFLDLFLGGILKLDKPNTQCPKRHESSCLYIGGKWLVCLYIGSSSVDVPVHQK